MATTSCNTKNSNCFHKTTHVIFDLDGTLMDTEKIYGEVINKIVGKFGIQIPESIKTKFLGLPCCDALEMCLKELELPTTLEELLKSYRRMVLEKLSDSTLCDGAERLIKHFHSHNIPMAIATNSENEAAKIKVGMFKELFGLVHHMVTVDDVLHGKPSPDMYLLAMQKFPDHPRAESCLVFEDSPNGMKAALAAHMQCVFLNTESNNAATLTVKSLNEFQPELFGMPPIADIKESEKPIKNN